MVVVKVRDQHAVDPAPSRIQDRSTVTAQVADPAPQHRVGQQTHAGIFNYGGRVTQEADVRSVQHVSLRSAARYLRIELVGKSSWVWPRNLATRSR